MQELRYERPTSIAEAARQLAVDGARALAGGTDLIAQMREGRRPVACVVDLKHVPPLNSIEQRPDGSWRIGAAVSISALARHQPFCTAHAALLDAARLIGSLQIQSRATLAGNLCNAAPSADAVPLLIALGAEAEIAAAASASPRCRPAADIPVAPGRTSLAAGEFVTALLIPPQPARSAARYLRFTPRREMDIAIAGAGVRIDLAGDGTIADARIVLASVAPVPLLAPVAAGMLKGEHPTEALLAAAADQAAVESRPISDTRASADYRRTLVGVLTRRALADCAARLGVRLS